MEDAYKKVVVFEPGSPEREITIPKPYRPKK